MRQWAMLCCQPGMAAQTHTIRCERQRTHDTTDTRALHRTYSRTRPPPSQGPSTWLAFAREEAALRSTCTQLLQGKGTLHVRNSKRPTTWCNQPMPAHLCRTNLHSVELIQHVQLRNVDGGVPVDHVGILQHDNIQPTAATLAAGAVGNHASHTKAKDTKVVNSPDTPFMSGDKQNKHKNKRRNERARPPSCCTYVTPISAPVVCMCSPMSEPSAPWGRAPPPRSSVSSGVHERNNTHR